MKKMIITMIVFIFTSVLFAQDVYPLPYVQDFENIVDLSEIDWEGDMAIMPSHGKNGSYGLTKNLYGLAGFYTGYAITPAIGLITDPAVLSFDYRIADWNGYPFVPTYLIAGDVIGVLISADDEPFTEIFEINETNHEVSTDFTNISIPLSGYTGKTIKAKFMLQRASGDYFVDIDNFRIREMPTSPIISINPLTINFGITPINDISIHSFSISNIGIGELVIYSISLGEQNSNQFNLINDSILPTVILPEENQIFHVSFFPLSLGEKSAQLRIMSNISDTPHTISLTGEGIDATIRDFPYVQDFSTSPPQYWSRKTGLLTENSMLYPYISDDWLSYWHWSIGNFAGNHTHPYGASAIVNICDDHNHWLITPEIDLAETTGEYYLSFDIALTSYIGSEPETFYADNDVFAVIISIDNGLTWSDAHTLARWDNQGSDRVYNNLSPTGEFVYISLAGYTGSVKIAFYGGSQETGADNNLYLDNVTIGYNPTLPDLNPPRNLVATIRNRDVILAWESPQNTENLRGYMIYKNNNALTGTITTMEYIDQILPLGGSYEYYVTAVYTNGLSTPSNIAIAEISSVLKLSPRDFNASLIDYNPVMSPNVERAKGGGSSYLDVYLSWAEPDISERWFTHAQSDLPHGAYGFGEIDEFMIAQRFTPEQLAYYGIAGARLSHISFMSNSDVAMYILKVWIGGSDNPLQAGVLIHEQVVGAGSIYEWEEVELDSWVHIPIDEELWIGYHVLSISGNPALVDFGSASDGFGNLIYRDGQWTTLSSLPNPIFFGNWMIKGKTENNYYDLTSPIGYNLYRDNILLTNSPISELNFTDNILPADQVTYRLIAVYDDGQSLPVTSIVDSREMIIEHFPFREGFEGNVFPPLGWQNLDIDRDGFSWLQYGHASTGKACAASTSYINGIGAIYPDNWLITPKIKLPTTDSDQSYYLKYQVAAENPEWPVEQYSIMISTTDSAPDNFTEIFSETLYTHHWQQKELNISLYEGQTIYIAFRHHNIADVSYLKIDDIWIGTEAVSEHDLTINTYVNKLYQNFPNPFNPTTTIQWSVGADSVRHPSRDKARLVPPENRIQITIYNIKGQKVRKLVDDYFKPGKYTAIWNGTDDQGKSVASGIYFYRLITDDYIANKKMLLIK